MKRRQKIFLGAFLCLSVCMIITAFVRVLGFKIKDTYIIAWGLFWHQTEAAVAIITVSTTAFRSLLGLKAQKAQKKKLVERYWIELRPQLLAGSFSKQAREEESEYEQLSSVLGATLTRMHKFTDSGEGIWDNIMAMEMAKQSDEDTPGAPSHKPQEIEVPRHISTTSSNSRRS